MHRRAFTLIELIITISIIALLSGMAAVSYTGFRQRGRDAQRKNDLSQIKIALSTYYNAQQPVQYVTAATQITIDSSTDALSTTLEPNYLRQVPVDPMNTGNFVYTYQSLNSAANFKLTATLENQNDKNGWNGGNGWVAHGYIVQDE